MNKELNANYYAIVENFINEVDQDPRASLPAKDAAMARLAVLLGCQGKDAFKELAKDVLEQAILTHRNTGNRIPGHRLFRLWPRMPLHQSHGQSL